MGEISRTVRTALASGVILLGVSAGAVAQRTTGLGDICRRELMTICSEGELRGCVRAKRAEFSRPCLLELRALAGARAQAGRQLPPGATELAYGVDARQRLDFYAARSGGKPAPVIVFIHGGGWSIGDKRLGVHDKAAHYTARGYALASVNYRLVPQATVEQQAADIAAALAMLRRDAGRLGVDPNRIIVMGHSAGAHLAALIATDENYLAAAGVPLAAVAGAVLLDGAGYDVSRQMSRPGNPVQPMYRAAFGDDPARQHALSPVMHGAAPNVANFLILPVANRPASIEQARALASVLSRAGSRATVTSVPDATHASLNRDLGRDGDFATGEVDRFLRSLTSSS